MLFSVLVPTKAWVPARQPLVVTNRSDVPVTMVLTDFSGRVLEAKGDMTVAAGADADIRKLYPATVAAGAYVLWAVPAGRQLPDFVGTPLVLTVRADRKPGAPNPNEVLVTKIEPLRYGVITTDKGAITCVFYYDVAPNTTATIQTLAEQGYFDGLVFHRVIPGFVIQGGDPLGDGSGGPGFNTNAEFSDRKHEAGVLSMARRGDSLEQQGMPPRAEFANSASSSSAPRLPNRWTENTPHSAKSAREWTWSRPLKASRWPTLNPANRRPHRPSRNSRSSR